LAGAFFTGVFLAGDFLAAVSLADDFLADVAFAAAVLVPDASRCYAASSGRTEHSTAAGANR
jgi:hypothetical protein